ncbi:beta-lactamase/transpeptidase-like protein [Cercophora newfieldiana]|uniref:Beta-lactamase/transpeptidase-like protein n=1 Tax=Cercophora newfieldiana TaxID=92897 RepID=A0AA39YHG0_9PEZI|nr:beta-lactamase/transpeptidase-like protein [Cercophora newfieldiana]
MRNVIVGLLAAANLPLAWAKSNCPLYGPIWPRPKNLLYDPGILYAASILDDIFPKYIDNDNSTGSEYFSYSVEVFTGSEDKPIWSHYWTAPSLAKSNTTGVTKITGDTVYRIGSITKIFTMLTFLAAVGDGMWNDPITKYLPDIAELANEPKKSNIFGTDWESITVGSLANSILGELSYQIPLENLYKIGFPPVPMTEYPPCGHDPACNRTQLIKGIGGLPPSFAPFTTPTYSDLGFTLLAHIAERLTGKNFKDLMQEKVLGPLNLKHTFTSKPDDAFGVIPGSYNRSTWAGDLGEEWPTGNMYTSSTDMSTLGRAILRSTLLKPATTRRWLKPVSFTSDPKAMVGMPWGVRRIDLVDDQPYQFIHTYNKAGSIGSYYTLLALLPELDIGYSVMVAGTPPGSLTMDIAEALTGVYIPTLTFVAQAQANATYSGTYRYTGNLTTASNTTASYNATTGRLRRRQSPLPLPTTNSTGSIPTPLNSTLTIIAHDGKPGMGVYNWISNSTDMSPIAVAINSNLSSEYFDRMKPSVRLYPTGLEDPLPNGGKKVAFKAVFEDLSLPQKNATYVSDCAMWVGVTSAVYGGRPLDLFIFEMDARGRVVGVENAALRLGMEKVS